MATLANGSQASPRRTGLLLCLSRCFQSPPGATTFRLLSVLGACRLNSLSPRGPGLSIRKRCSAQWDVMGGQGATPAGIGGRTAPPVGPWLAGLQSPVPDACALAALRVCSPRRRPSHPTAQLVNDQSAPGRSLGAHRSTPLGLWGRWVYFSKGDSESKQKRK